MAGTPPGPAVALPTAPNTVVRNDKMRVRQTLAGLVVGGWAGGGWFGRLVG